MRKKSSVAWFKVGDSVRVSEPDCPGLEVGQILTVAAIALNVSTRTGHPQVLFFDGILREPSDSPAANPDPDERERAAFSGWWFESAPKK